MPILYTPTYPIDNVLVNHKCALPSPEDAPKGTIYECDEERCGKLYRLKDSEYPVKTGLIWKQTNRFMLHLLPIIHFFIIEFRALNPRHVKQTQIQSANIPISYYKER
jgi:hypothetical protein